MTRDAKIKTAGVDQLAESVSRYGSRVTIWSRDLQPLTVRRALVSLVNR